MLIRKLKKSDQKVFIEEINKTWEYDKFIGEKEGLLCSKILFFEYLVKSNYICVIEEKKKILGILMLDNKNKKKIFIVRNIYLIFLKYILRLYKKGDLFLEMQKNEEQICDILCSKPQHKYELELKLVIIINKYRNQGYGRKILNIVFDYMQKENISSLYLLTDEWCNLKFYEKLKFRKVSAVEGYLSESLKKAKYYLYDYEKHK